MSLLLDELKKFSEFDAHELVVPVLHEGKIRGYIAVHRWRGKKLAVGGTRYWAYNTEEDALRDALKLSRAMSSKHVLAGSYAGGAKGVLIAAGNNPGEKEKLLESYAKAVNMLEGRFVTGMDVGLSREDVIFLKTFSQHFVGIEQDPSEFTGMGILLSLETCFREVFASKELVRGTFALQGLGKVGNEVLKRIYSDTHKIFVTDTDQKKVSTAKEKFPLLHVVAPEDIYDVKADVFLPCAMGNVFNNETISRLKFKIICGGANDQLSDTNAGKILFEKNILYAPDYVVNAGGLLAAMDDYEFHNFDRPRLTEKVKSIPLTLQKIFDESKRLNLPTNVIADEMVRKEL